VGVPEMVIFSAILSEGTPQEEAAWRGDVRMQRVGKEVAMISAIIQSRHGGLTKCTFS
jgi:hypothetical protein